MRIPRLELGCPLLILSVIVIGTLCADSALHCSMSATDGAFKPEWRAGTVQRISWSSDGTQLLARSRAGADGLSWLTAQTVMSDGVDRVPYYENPFATLDAVISPDGQRTLVCCERGKLWWFDLQSYETTELELRTPNGNFFHSLALSHDGRLMACSTQQGEVYVRNDRGTGIVVLTSQRDASVTELRFSNDDRRLLVVRHNGAIEIWNLETGKLLSERERPSSGLTTATFLADHGKVISFCGSQPVEIWDVNRGSVVDQMSSEVPDGFIIPVLDVSSDGRSAAWGRSSNRIIVWDLEKSHKRCEINSPSSVTHITFSPDGASLAVAGDEDHVRIYDVTTGRQIRTIDTRPRGAIADRF